MVDPVAFQIGSLTIRWYGIFISLALLIGFVLATREAERQKINLDAFLNIILFTVPLSILGSRLYYVVFKWSYYRHNPGEILMIWQGGLSIHGAVITGLLVGYLLTRYYKIDFLKAADIVAPSLILGQAIGRWGNYFNQEAYGYPTDLPWAMYIAGEYRHPTFLYESIWNLLVFAVLLWLRRQEKIRSGDVFLTYISAYSFGRFFIEGLRTDSLMLGPYRSAQIFSILVICGVLAYRFWYIKRKHEEDPSLIASKTEAEDKQSYDQTS